MESEAGLPEPEDDKRRSREEEKGFPRENKSFAEENKKRDLERKDGKKKGRVRKKLKRKKGRREEGLSWKHNLTDLECSREREKKIGKESDGLDELGKEGDGMGDEVRLPEREWP